MPETAGRTPPTSTPKLTEPKPLENDQSRKTHSGAGRPQTGSRPDSKELGRTTSSEWIDVDESHTRRRKSGKRSSRQHTKSPRSATGNEIGHRKPGGKGFGFLPNLSKILESSESATASSRASKGPDRRRQQGTKATGRKRRSDASLILDSSSRHRPLASRKKAESFLKANPSLLSVLSSFTANSDRSSHSGSTVTQQSYNRQSGFPKRETSNISRRRGPHANSTMSSSTQSKSVNVFDYMQTSVVDDAEDDAQSVTSSYYARSDVGSSVAPDTPSSRSTFPSPTSTRYPTDTGKRYDLQYANSNRSHSSSPDSSRISHLRPSVSDVPEEDEEGLCAVERETYVPRRPSSRSSAGSRRRSVQLHQQEESLRQHIAQTQQGHYVDPYYGQKRSHSSSSAHSDRSQYNWHTAMQPYQWPPHHPANAPPTPPHAIVGPTPPNNPLAVPDPPDLSKRTIAGYEELALELSTTESPVKPLYRKFEYLNHRILLHLQDELSEMEESLRTMDEFIAQLNPSHSEGHKPSASRRNDAFRGNELHLQRTELLGRIFMKTEQYNRAMSTYAATKNQSIPAEDDQVASYQEWMNKHTPIAEVETRFLLHHQDLIVPGSKARVLDRPTKHAALAYLPVALMLPLLLYSIIPSLAGRLVVTALIAVAAFMVAATTRIRQLMPPREWAFCGGVYVLLMAAIAGCIPSHG